MKTLTAPEIIELWETACRFHPVDQALAVLLRALPGCSRDELAALPLGQRDARLLAVRRATFGDALPGRSRCPQCSESVEFELSCRALQAGQVEPRPGRFHQDGYSATVRPLNSFDLAAAAGADSVQQARTVLLQRCLSELSYENQTIEADALPPAIQNRIADMAQQADPQAELLLDLECPACEHHWQSMLDIGQLLWMEISARAQRLLMEVHLLAKAYGWSEAETLELSAARRAVYLQMVTA